LMGSTGAMGEIEGPYPNGQIALSLNARALLGLRLTDFETRMIKEERVQMKIHPRVIYDIDPVWLVFVFDNKVNNIVAAEIWACRRHMFCGPVNVVNHVSRVQSKKLHLDKIPVRDNVLNPGSVELTVVMGCFLQNPRNAVGIWFHVVFDKTDPISSHTLIWKLEDKEVFW